MKRLLASQGFTLLEIIFTFVLFGIVAVMAVSYFGVGITRTDIAKNQLQTDANLQLVMENMIADQTTAFSTNLVGFSDKINNVNVSQSTYGSGTSYIVTDKRFVCPSNSSFVNNNTSNQFLLVTIKPDLNSGVSLTYLFSANTGNCNVTGGGS